MALITKNKNWLWRQLEPYVNPTRLNLQETVQPVIDVGWDWPRRDRDIVNLDYVTLAGTNTFFVNPPDGEVWLVEFFSLLGAPATDYIVVYYAKDAATQASIYTSYGIGGTPLQVVGGVSNLGAIPTVQMRGLDPIMLTGQETLAVVQQSIAGGDAMTVRAAILRYKDYEQARRP